MTASETLETRSVEPHASERHEVQELLQVLLLGELLSPSRSLWLLAKDLPDLPVLDNSGAAFSAIEPLWERRWLLLSEILGWLAHVDTKVTVVLSPGDHEEFRRHLQLRLPQSGSSRVIIADVIEEAFLSDEWCLSGTLDWRAGRRLLLDRNAERCRQHASDFSARFGDGR